MKAKCAHAKVLHEKCTLSSKTAAEPTIAQATNVNGDHNTVHTTTSVDNSVDNSVVNIYYVGSREELLALQELFKNADTLKALWTLPECEMPARLFELWKGADAPDQLKNIRVQGDKVHEVRGPDHVVPVTRSKFVKKMVADILHTVDAVPASATPDPPKMDDIHGTVRATKFHISKRAVAAPEVARLHQQAAPELRHLDSEGRDFLRRAKHNFEQTLDEPTNEFVQGPRRT